MWLCLVVGRVGFMPMDQSIVFDGGWRILTGQVPSTDYHSPSALLPSALQALVFAALGVHWFAYCLHAALFNGLFALLAHRLLRALGVGALPAVVGGLASAVVFYPPFGVPYPEQHAFYFGLAAVAAGVFAWTRPARAALVPWCALAAVLCKPIPGLLFAPLLVFVLLRGSRAELRRRGLVLAASSAGLLLACGLLAALTGLSWSAVAADTFGASARLGDGRVARLLASPALLVERLDAVRAAWGSWPVLLAPLLAGAALVGWCRRGARRGRRLLLVGGAVCVVAALVPASFALTAPARWSPLVRGWSAGLGAGACLVAALLARRVHGTELLRHVLAAGLWFVAVAFCVLTVNQPENGAAFVFLALVLQWTLAGHVPARHQRTVRAALVLLVVGLAVSFHLRVNLTRRVHDGLTSTAVASPAPPGMEFLRWRAGRQLRYGPAELGAVIEELRRRAGPVAVFGDATVVAGLAGRPSVLPALWLHAGLTLPRPGTPAAEAWAAELSDALRAGAVVDWVTDGPRSLGGLRVEDYPELAATVEALTTRQRRFGTWTVRTLRSAPATAAPDGDAAR